MDARAFMYTLANAQALAAHSCALLLPLILPLLLLLILLPLLHIKLQVHQHNDTPPHLLDSRFTTSHGLRAAWFTRERRRFRFPCSRAYAPYLLPLSFFSFMSITARGPKLDTHPSTSRCSFAAPAEGFGLSVRQFHRRVNHLKMPTPATITGPHNRQSRTPRSLLNVCNYY